MKLYLKKFGIPEEQGMDIIDLDNSPCPTITAGGLSRSGHGQYWIEDMGIDLSKHMYNKPPYVIPTMAEISAIPWNGYRVISTFSGCGGSCIGYRMAGFKVIWANEFVPAAQESYRANMEAGCILDLRDIKHVATEDILRATGLQSGELDLFDGSPPCQAFSTAGKREKGWGKLKAYEHGAQQKNEELFFDYIRLLDGLQPKIFVAENVSGLVKGTAKGFFLEILAGLKACGYNVKAKLLDAQWLGVPQMRQRVIFIGVRNDLGLEPVHPKPLAYRYSVRDALPWIVAAKAEKHGPNWPDSTMHSEKPAPAVLTSKNFGGWYRHQVAVITGRLGTGYQRTAINSEEPIYTITASGAQQTRYEVGIEKRQFTIAEVKRLCSFPEDFVLTGNYAQQWERLGNSVPPVMMYHIAAEIRDRILTRSEI